MFNIYAKTMYQKRFMIVGWFVGVTLITLLTMSVYNSFSSGALGDSLQNLPPALKSIVGDGSSFKTVGGYVSQQVFALRMPLLLIIVSIAALVGIMGGEEQTGLLETQLSLPISRSRLLLQKLAAGFSIVVIASAGAIVGVASSLLVIHHSYDLFSMLPHLVSCVEVAFTYGLIGFTIASITGNRGLALGASSGFAFLSYLINSMAPSVSILQGVDKLTLFHYYDTKGGYNAANLLLICIIALALVIISLIVFERRDIK